MISAGLLRDRNGMMTGRQPMETNVSPRTFLFALFAATSIPFAHGQASHHHGHGGETMQMAPTSAVPAFVEGEVRDLDRNAGKVTLKHGPIENIGMPAMTMTFSVKDPAQLKGVKAGDAIRFKAERIEDSFVVTQLAPR